jgi:cytochrome c peroxidase
LVNDAGGFERQTSSVAPRSATIGRTLPMCARTDISRKRGAAAWLFAVVPAWLLAVGIALAAGDLTPQERALVLSLSPLQAPPPDPTNAVSGQCAAIDFGRNLFFDVRLSRHRNRSCASCHVPDEGFADGRAVAFAPRVLRNTPSAWNVAYNRWFFWDGRADSLWAQTAGPIEAAAELNLDRVELARRIATEPDLAREYQVVFGPLPELDGAAGALAAASARRSAATRVLANVAKAIAAFEETLVSRDAPFDRFVRVLRSGAAGGPDALPAAAVRGLKLFVGRGQCVQCHSGPNFSDGEFHDMRALAGDEEPEDPGRYRGLELLEMNEFRADGPFADAAHAGGIAKLESVVRGEFTRGQFKTPSLRNVGERAAFLHHGRIASLKAAVGRYATLPAEVRADGRADPRVASIQISAAEVDDLVAFLHTLTDTSQLEAIWEDCGDRLQPP